MNSKYIDTAILSISSNNINKCKDITEMFVKTGILCSVSSNDSVINNNGKYIFTVQSANSCMSETHYRPIIVMFLH